MNAPFKDPLVLFMSSGRRGRFPGGTPWLDAARYADTLSARVRKGDFSIQLSRQ